LRARFDDVLLFPLAGAARDGIRRGLRVLIHRNYAIYYRVERRAVVVVRVIHGARDVRALAKHGGFN
jgi:toxin ParE1/3/4